MPASASEICLQILISHKFFAFLARLSSAKNVRVQTNERIPRANLLCSWGERIGLQCAWEKMAPDKGHMRSHVALVRGHLCVWGIVKGAPSLVFICPLDTRFINFLIFIYYGNHIRSHLSW